MDVLSILFSLTIITFPLGEVVRFQLPGNVNVSLFDLSVILTGTVWLLTILRGNRKYLSYPLTRPILLFFLTLLLSLIANVFRYQLTELGVAALYALRWLLFASMYFVVRDVTPSFRRVLPDALTLSGAAILVIGYVQYFYYSNLRNLFYLGWDDHLYRMFSSFLDPNFAGAFFVLYFLFLLGQLFTVYSSSGARSKQFSSHSVRTITISILAFATFAAIFLTTSRSAFLMLAAGLIIFFMLIGQKKWLFIFAGITVIIIIPASRFFYLENVNPLRIASSEARVETARNALTIIAQNPVFGVGFNAYRYAQYAYGFRNPDTRYPSHADSGTDNSFLFVFATAGVAGFAAFLHLLYRIYYTGKQQKNRVQGAVLIAMLVGIVINSLFINSLFYPHLMFWLWVMAGITDYT
jgi:putative inorganic carbon (hco3(-)) transporter